MTEEQMPRSFCIHTDIPPELSKIDDELKAIYHSKDSVCFFILRTVADRNRFMQETLGMNRAEREAYHLHFYEQ